MPIQEKQYIFEIVLVVQRTTFWFPHHQQHIAMASLLDRVKECIRQGKSVDTLGLDVNESIESVLGLIDSCGDVVDKVAGQHLIVVRPHLASAVLVISL